MVIINFESYPTMSTAPAFFSTLSAGSSFCPECGSLLVLPELNPIVCTTCSLQCNYEDLPNLEVITKCNPRDPPAALQVVTKGRDEEEEERNQRHRATVDEACPKCGHPQLEFYLMQLRSADEGQTVFYECSNCAHKFSQNN